MADDKNPWQRKPDGPPDLLNELKKFFGNKSGATPGATMTWIWIVAVLAIVIWGLTGIFVVKQAEQAVVLKFGKYAETVGPGPHWIPTFIESSYKVDIQQIRNFKYESEMLTEDENILIVPVNVQYRIDNVRDYLFNVVNPAQAIQQATASALRASIGQMTLDDILTKGREQLRADISKQLVDTLKIYNPGIVVTDVRLQKIVPPEAVTAAFDDAINAREDEKSYIKMGQSYSNKVTSEVVGQVAKLMQAAEGYREQVVLQAKGDVARYDAVLEPYLKAPSVTRERLYIDAIQSVLSHTNNVIVDSGAHNVLYLPLDKMLSKHTTLSGDKLHEITPATVASTPASNTNQADQAAGVAYGSPRSNYSDGGAHS